MPKWKKKKENVFDYSFVEDVGPVIEVVDQSELLEVTEGEVFNTLVGEDLFELMVFQTNLYATQKHKPFTPTNVKEIKSFIAVNFLMGIKTMPSYKDYWSSDPMLRDPYISNIMTLKRFQWLLANFHLNDNSQMPSRDDPNFDKLYKLRPLLDGLNQQYSKCYKPTEYQAVDESMIKFKGRSSLKQYLPLKPIKRGYKVWVRADSNGYVCQFEVYTGKGKIQGFGLGESVVERLCKPLIGKSYKIFADNFFSSIPLAYSLQGKKIGYCGTIRASRKHIPELKKDKTMERGDIDWRMAENGVSITKWMDNKAVYFVSNMHDPSIPETTTRKKKDGTQLIIGGSLVSKDYNKHMGYVDKADMLKSVYGLDRKSRKWWHRIAFHFLDVSLVNAFILFMNVRETKIPLKEFKLNLIHRLLGATAFRQPKSKRNSTAAASVDTKRHKATISSAIR